MTSYLVRHADAGDRKRWSGPDEARPLSAQGRRQAEGLVRALRGAELRRVVTSSYVRCRETVEPLAQARGLAIEYDERLVEGADPAATLELITVDGEGAVLCSHGDVVSAVVIRLADAGVALDGGMRWEKCSIWALDVELGRVRRGTYIPPPPTG